MTEEGTGQSTTGYSHSPWRSQRTKYTVTIHQALLLTEIMNAQQRHTPVVWLQGADVKYGYLTAIAEPVAGVTGADIRDCRARAEITGTRPARSSSSCQPIAGPMKPSHGIADLLVSGIMEDLESGTFTINPVMDES
jgi:hypothetical protein